MLLSTNGINMNKLQLKSEKIKQKSLDYYKKEIKETIKEVEEYAEKGIAIFRRT
jgi:hypothetical protein